MEQEQQQQMQMQQQQALMEQAGQLQVRQWTQVRTLIR